MLKKYMFEQTVKHKLQQREIDWNRLSIWFRLRLYERNKNRTFLNIYKRNIYTSKKHVDTRSHHHVKPKTYHVEHNQHVYSSCYSTAQPTSSTCTKTWHSNQGAAMLSSCVSLQMAFVFSFAPPISFPRITGASAAYPSFTSSPATHRARLASTLLMRFPSC